MATTVCMGPHQVYDCLRRRCRNIMIHIVNSVNSMARQTWYIPFVAHNCQTLYSEHHHRHHHHHIILSFILAFTFLTNLLFVWRSSSHLTYMLALTFIKYEINMRFLFDLEWPATYGRPEQSRATPSRDHHQPQLL